MYSVSIDRIKLFNIQPRIQISIDEIDVKVLEKI